VKQSTRLFVAGLELTTACPCRCDTCGTAAGRPRARELSTDEWLTVVGSLGRLGCKRLTLLGGEPFLHEGWHAIARRATELGIQVDLVSCGLGIDDEIVRAVRASGMISITISVDGSESIHDRSRRTPGGYLAALDAIARLDRAGMRVGVTTQVNRLTLPTFEELAEWLQAAGAIAWQLQLTMPTGRARVHRECILEPSEMPLVHAILRRLVARRGLRPYITDNIGYLTRDEPLLRTPSMQAPRTFCGCYAGLRAMGITSEGNVKGCLALPDELVEGNVRSEPLERIWLDSERFSYCRAFEAASLAPSCAECAYGTICRGGCTAMSLAATGRPNQGTYCLRLQGVA
jgi:radical SAM protein with 4Fe4S-binding SPASM domain